VQHLLAADAKGAGIIALTQELAGVMSRRSVQLEAGKLYRIDIKEIP